MKGDFKAKNVLGELRAEIRIQNYFAQKLVLKFLVYF